jgi:pheromone shutdown protein TraB
MKCRTASWKRLWIVLRPRWLNDRTANHVGQTAHFQYAVMSSSIRTFTTYNGGTAVVIGVSHLSQRSVDLATSTIYRLQPEYVLLELDAERAAALGIITDPFDARPQHTDAAFCREVYSTDISPRVYPGILPFLWAAAASAATLIYSSLLKKSQYGGEQIAAARAASRVGAKLLLADRSISVTLARLGPEIQCYDIWYMLPSILSGMALKPHHKPSSWSIAKMLWFASMSKFKRLADTIEEIELEANAADAEFGSSHIGRCFTALNALLTKAIRDGSLSRVEQEELCRRFEAAVSSLELREGEWMPAAISTERDTLLSHAILTAPGKTVVAVVGQGHLEAIARYAGGKSSRDIPSLLQPPPFHMLRVAVLPVSAVLAGSFGFHKLWKASRRAAVGVAGMSALAVMSSSFAILGVKSTHQRMKTAFHAQDSSAVSSDD